MEFTNEDIPTDLAFVFEYCNIPFERITLDEEWHDCAYLAIQGYNLLQPVFTWLYTKEECHADEYEPIKATLARLMDRILDNESRARAPKRDAYIRNYFTPWSINEVTDWVAAGFIDPKGLLLPPPSLVDDDSSLTTFSDVYLNRKARRAGGNIRSNTWMPAHKAIK